MELTDLKSEATHVEKDPSKEAAGDVVVAQVNAQGAADAEHAMPVREALRVYSKAIMWSFVISLAIIMESYDIQIITSFFAFPAFQKKYGVPLGNGKYTIEADWQVALSLAATVGVTFGLFANGWLIDHFGHRNLTLGALVVLTGTIFITFFAGNVQTLLAGEILCGLPWGVLSTIAPSYAAEVCPTKLRGYLIAAVNLCWVIGHLIAAGVLDGLVHNHTQWAYRIPFAIQWAWPVPLCVLIAFAPHSPWWLVRKGRVEQARKTVARLSSGSDKVNPAETVAQIVRTTQLERDLGINGNYLDCFRGSNLWRTEIACVGWGAQVLVGWAMQNYATYFFTLAGLPSSQAYKLSLGMYSISFVGTATFWILHNYFGRRTLFLAGVFAMIPTMLTIGFLSLGDQSHDGLRWGQSILMLVWYGEYGLTLGPLPFVIAAEVGASRLRNKTISLARITFSICQIVNAVVAPYMLNPLKANMKGHAAFVTAGITIVISIWAFFRLPELKGRTYEELDVLFEKRVSARQFKNYVLTVEDFMDVHTAHPPSKVCE
ncbi:hypothetical protein CLAIMM_04407 [Cladophialophora immunda]|nr:hypothetical protein CLAIMM_04407 [Cladophialophora immunda]